MSLPEYQRSEHYDAVRVALLDPNGQIEYWRESYARSIRRDLWDAHRYHQLATDALASPEAFRGQHDLALSFREDIRKQRERLYAALFILEYAHPSTRRKFILRDGADREGLVDWVLGNGGIYDKSRLGRTEFWLELPS